MIFEEITPSDYNAMLEDSKMTVGELSAAYGHGWSFRLQCVLCAVAVHTAAADATMESVQVKTATDLYRIVDDYEYVRVFEDVDLDAFRPEEKTLCRLMYMMCQAATGDYTGGVPEW